eukprot:5041282-Pleurochrysis_carterae.AAC.3
MSRATRDAARASGRTEKSSAPMRSATRLKGDGKATHAFAGSEPVTSRIPPVGCMQRFLCGISTRVPRRALGRRLCLHAVAHVEEVRADAGRHESRVEVARQAAPDLKSVKLEREHGRDQADRLGDAQQPLTPLAHLVGQVHKHAQRLRPAASFHTDEPTEEAAQLCPA